MLAYRRSERIGGTRRAERGTPMPGVKTNPFPPRAPKRNQTDPAISDKSQTLHEPYRKSATDAARKLAFRGRENGRRSRLCAYAAFTLRQRIFTPPLTVRWRRLRDKLGHNHRLSKKIARTAIADQAYNQDERDRTCELAEQDQHPTEEFNHAVDAGERHGGHSRGPRKSPVPNRFAK
jgi:hypothetical protein